MIRPWFDKKPYRRRLQGGGVYSPGDMRVYSDEEARAIKKQRVDTRRRIEELEEARRMEEAL